MASINGLQNNALIVNTIDGLTTLYATSIYDNGQSVNPALYVPYSGATGTVDLNAQNIIDINTVSAVSGTLGSLGVSGTTTLTGVSSGTSSTYLALNASNQIVSVTGGGSTVTTTASTSAGPWYPTFVAYDTGGSGQSLYVDGNGYLNYNALTGGLSCQNLNAPTVETSTTALTLGVSGQSTSLLTLQSNSNGGALFAGNVNVSGTLTASVINSSTGGINFEFFNTIYAQFLTTGLTFEGTACNLNSSGANLNLQNGGTTGASITSTGISVVAQYQSTSATYYIPFLTSYGSLSPIWCNIGLIYNPSTQTVNMSNLDCATITNNSSSTALVINAGTGLTTTVGGTTVFKQTATGLSLPTLSGQTYNNSGGIGYVLGGTPSGGIEYFQDQTFPLYYSSGAWTSGVSGSNFTLTTNYSTVNFHGRCSFYCSSANQGVYYVLMRIYNTTTSTSNTLTLSSIWMNSAGFHYPIPLIATGDNLTAGTYTTYFYVGGAGSYTSDSNDSFVLNLVVSGN